MAEDAVVEKLAGTDRRSIGLAGEVAKEIAGDQSLFDQVFGALWHDDPVMRMRAADAVEKASRTNPERLLPHKEALLGELAAVAQQEVRWHLAQLLPRLPLDRAERHRAAAIVESFFDDKSAIVRVNALQALVDLARDDAALKDRAHRRLLQALESGTAAEKARARKLLPLLAGSGTR